MNGHIEAVVGARREGGLRRTLTDIGVLTRRNTLTALRRPNALVGNFIQPAVFLTLMMAVFGNAIRLPGGADLIDQVMPAVVIMGVSLTAMTAGGSLALDLESGMMERFRALPIARTGVIAARAADATLRMVPSALVVTAVGFLFGFGFQQGLGAALGFYAVSVTFGFGFSWYAMAVALMTRSFQAVGGIMFLTFFPLVFLSGAFVPVAALPDWLEPFARVNFMTPLADTLRGLSVGGEVVTPLLTTLAWVVAFTAVFGALAARNYRRV